MFGSRLLSTSLVPSTVRVPPVTGVPPLLGLLIWRPVTGAQLAQSVVLVDPPLPGELVVLPLPVLVPLLEQPTAIMATAAMLAPSCTALRLCHRTGLRPSSSRRPMPLAPATL